MDLEVLLVTDLLSVKCHLALKNAEAMIGREASEENYPRVVDYPVFLTTICEITYISIEQTRMFIIELFDLLVK